MKTILLYFNKDDHEHFSPDYLQQVQALCPDCHVWVNNEPAEIEAHLDEIEIAAGHIPPELLVRMPNLRWYQQWGAGADWLMHHPIAVEQDWTLVNVSGVHAVPISEHILALMLAFARRLDRAVRWKEQRTWKRPHLHDLFELDGKVLLLVGLGATGGRTARVASALGMHVWGVRRNPTEPAAGVEAMFGPNQLHEVLHKADFVVLTLPLTHETRGMFGTAELRAMKRSAYLINVGRGATVQTHALIQALQEGWIAGAGLDVLETEPLPHDSPLWELENVILTCHYSGLTPHYHERAMDIFMENLRRARAGEPLRNIVDKQLGY